MLAHVWPFLGQLLDKESIAGRSALGQRDERGVDGTATTFILRTLSELDSLGGGPGSLSPMMLVIE